MGLLRCLLGLLDLLLLLYRSSLQCLDLELLLLLTERADGHVLCGGHLSSERLGHHALLLLGVGGQLGRLGLRLNLLLLLLLDHVLDGLCMLLLEL